MSILTDGQYLTIMNKERGKEMKRIEKYSSNGMSNLFNKLILYHKR